MFNFFKPNPSILSQLKKIALYNPQKKAIITEKGAQISYSDFISQILSISGELNLKNAHNIRIGLANHNASDFLIFSTAITSIASCVPLSNKLTPKELKTKVDRIGIDLIVTDVPNYLTETYQVFIPKTPVNSYRRENNKIIFEIDSETPFNKKHKQTPAFIVETSGSTNEPKIVPIEEKKLISAAMSMIKALEISNEDKCLNMIPMHFIHGFITLGYVPLLAGGSIVFTGAFNQTLFGAWMKLHNPTWFSASPAIYSSLLKLNNLTKKSIGNNRLRFLRIGSAPLKLETQQEIEKIFNCQLLDGYGMSETLVISCNTLLQNKKGTVGKVIGPDVKIVDSTYSTVPQGNEGSIWVKGKSLFNGYLTYSSFDRSSFKKGWFITGDSGSIDNEGYLKITGRTKDFINKDGVKINPFEVEQVIKKIEDISEVSIIKIPHPTLGEDFICVYTTNSITPLSKHNLQTELKKTISNEKIPSNFHWFKYLPKSENDKVLKRKILSEISSNPSLSKTKFDEKQNKIAQLLGRCLNTHVTSVEDDFFSLGGTSLDAIDLISVLEREFNVKITAELLFQNPTIRSIALYIKSLSESSNTAQPDFQQQLLLQKSFLNKWPGYKLGENHYIKSINKVDPTIPTLIWCFQNASEFVSLSNAIKGKINLLGLRSGHLVFSMNDDPIIEQMANIYEKEILSLELSTQVYLGGNCQGGKLIFETAKKLNDTILINALLIMEYNVNSIYNAPIHLIFGKESTKHNPFCFEKQPEKRWNQILKNYTSHEIPGQHGGYFTAERIPNLTSVISKIII